MPFANQVLFLCSIFNFGVAICSIFNFGPVLRCSNMELNFWQI
jgi:hypothetical protein